MEGLSLSLSALRFGVLSGLLLLNRLFPTIKFNAT